MTDKFTESMYVLANEPSVALYRLQEHVRRSLPELAQHKASRWLSSLSGRAGGREEIGHQRARCSRTPAGAELEGMRTKKRGSSVNLTCYIFFSLPVV